MESKFDLKTRSIEYDSSGFLFAQGKYRTKILPEDLPEYFVHGYLYKRYGYISAIGVSHLVYVPNYVFTNHLYKDDMLLISYKDTIESYETEGGFSWYKGYDELVSGHLIEKFVDAAEKYSQYNVDDIRKEIQRKEAWYYEHNPEKVERNQHFPLEHSLKPKTVGRSEGYFIHKGEGKKDLMDLIGKIEFANDYDHKTLREDRG